MNYTKDDVTRILRAYETALQQEKLIVPQKHQHVLERVLVQYFMEHSNVKKKEAVSERKIRSGMEFITSFGIPAITDGLRTHACLLYGTGGIAYYTEDDLFLLYQRVREEALTITYVPQKYVLKNLPRDVKLGLKSFYHIEQYFITSGRIMEGPFLALNERIVKKERNYNLLPQKRDELADEVQKKEVLNIRERTEILEEITRDAVRRKPGHDVSVVRDRGVGSVVGKYKKSEVEKPVCRDENVVKKFQTKRSKMDEDDDFEDEEREDVEFMDVDLDEKW